MSDQSEPNTSETASSDISDHDAGNVADGDDLSVALHELGAEIDRVFAPVLERLVALLPERWR